ncbi:MAG: histidinol-phosphate transaminase [Chromatiales bacterium]|nr:histidinol-phosphate transaminase [Chromatiales bacterium]
MATIDLLRPEIRALRAYQPAENVAGLVRLNANENPWNPASDRDAAALNRYPEARPTVLAKRLAAHYGLDPARLLVTRGSSEAIDLVIRSFCAAGRDRIVISPPTFGMYAVYAQIQGAGIREVSLDRDLGWRLPVDDILGGWSPADRLVFVCSPNNPTGTPVNHVDLRRLLEGLAGRGVVVLDAAYAEFAGEDPAAGLMDEFDNLLVLRTLSKALGLAGVRCGALLGPAELVEIIGRTLPPYCFPVTSQQAVLSALDEAEGRFAAQLRILVGERERVAAALAAHPRVLETWPSAANFILVRAQDPADFVAAARGGGVLVRDFSSDPWTPGCIRITIGAPEENDRLLEALR